MPRTRCSAFGKRQPHASGVFPSPKLVRDALHRPSSEPEGPSHLQDTHAFRKLVSHLPFSRAVYLRAAELHALSNRALEAGFDSLADHRSLKLSKGAC